jgi:TolB protein
LIAFELTRGDYGRSTIALIHANGTGLRPLLRKARGDEFGFSWSPDGELIAFASTLGTRWEIYVVGLDGKGLRDLAPGEDPRWSPDGRHIAFIRNDDVYVMGPGGSNVRRLIRTEGHEFDPEWSPDSREIIFSGEGSGAYDLYVVRVDGSGYRMLAHDAWNALFSPDGQRIVFMREPGDVPEIWTMAANGRNQKRLVAQAATEPSWSPDGRRVVFVDERPGQSYPRIAVIGADGRGAQTLTRGSSEDPAWSPDGSQIAWARGSAQSRSWDIWEMNADGSNKRRLTRSPLNDERPAWQPSSG